MCSSDLLNGPQVLQPMSWPLGVPNKHSFQQTHFTVIMLRYYICLLRGFLETEKAFARHTLYSLSYILCIYFPTLTSLSMFALHRQCRRPNVCLGHNCIACISANVPFYGSSIIRLLLCQRIMSIHHTTSHEACILTS